MLTFTLSPHSGAELAWDLYMKTSTTCIYGDELQSGGHVPLLLILCVLSLPSFLQCPLLFTS